MRTTTTVLVYIALSILWSTVAGTLQSRHDALNNKLRSDVAGLWGREHSQNLPRLAGNRPILTTDVKAKMKLDYRRKGQYWYSTYLVDFGTELTLEPSSKTDTLVFNLPTSGGMFSGFQVQVDGRESSYKTTDQGIEITVPPKSENVKLSYTGQGCDRWWLNFDKQGASQNLKVEVITNFKNPDFPDGSVSPLHNEDIDDGVKLSWSYENLLSGGKIGIELPKRSDPGPALISICRYAPLALLLFFAIFTVWSLESGRLAHPVEYSLMGCAFFTFHLMLVYLGDALPLWAAFTLASAITLAINFTYGTRVFGKHFTLTRLLPALLIYLVGFSTAFLNEGFRGLPLVLIFVLTLHLIMQISAKVDWNRLDGRLNPNNQGAHLP